MIIDAAGTKNLAAMANNPEKMDRAHVAREFEALLLAQVWKGALRSGDGSGLLDGGSAGRMYREMFIDEVARSLPGTHGVGLAERLTENLEGGSHSEPASEPSNLHGDRDHD